MPQYEFKAYLTVWEAESAQEASAKMQAALGEIAYAIVNGDLGVDLSIDESPAYEVAES